MKKIFPCLFFCFVFAVDLIAANSLSVTYNTDTKLVAPSGLIFSNAYIGTPTVGTNIANKDYVDNHQGGPNYDFVSPWDRAAYYGLSELYTFGDSHTYGQLAAGPYPFTDASSRLYSEYRYANQLADTNGLTLYNYAISGTSQMYPQIAGGPNTSHLNQIGHYLDAPTWSGVATTLGGFNDALPTMASDDWIRASRLANAAMIARLFVTNYVNLSNGRTATGTTNSTYSTTGSVLAGGNPTVNPFPWGDPASNDRNVLTLKSGQRLAITPSIGSTVLFYELTTDGGTASVYVNGTNVANINTSLPLPATTQRMPGALLIPYGTYSITVTNTSGTNYLMALGQLPAPEDVTNRVVVIGAPVQLSSSVRSRSVCENIGRAMYGAAVMFASYPIYAADPSSVIDPVTDIIGSADPNHFMPSGQRKIYQSFINAQRIVQPTRKNTYQGSLGEQVSINGTSSGTMWLGFARQGTNRIEQTINSSGDFVLSSIGANGSSIGNAITVNNADLGFTSGGYVRSSAGSGFSGANSTAPATDYMSLASVAGSGYLLSLAGGSLSTTRPLIVYANGVSYANAGTATSLTTSGLTDLGSITSAGIRSSVAGAFGGANSSAPAFNYMALAHTGGSGYLLSLSANTTGTTLPLIVYSSTLSLANAGNVTGATFVAPTLGAASATTLTTSGGVYSAGGGSFGGVPVAAARDAVLIYSSGGTGYIASLTNNSLSAKLPLSIYSSGLSLANAGNITSAQFVSPSLGNATATTVTTSGGLYSAGGLSVGGVPSAVNYNSVLLFSTGGRGYIGSYTNGSLSTLLPFSIASSSLDLSGAGSISGATFVAPNLGAATATSVAASGAVTGSNLSGTNTGDQTSATLPVIENTQTGTTYTVQSSDNGKVITLNNAAAITVTVPALSAQFSCTFIQKGAGQVTFSASGTTINNAHSQTKTYGQYSAVTLYGLSSTSFVLAGDTGS